MKKFICLIKATQNKCRILAVFALVFLLAGCGGASQELTDYKDNMAEDAEETLLHNLDNMERAFTEMAAYEIPEEFMTLGDLPVEAADYMSQAVAKYHEAYDNEYDAAAEEEAGAMYERANRRLQYIIDILHGEIPEGEDVEFVEE